MKYQIPKLRILSKALVNAICSTGSTASGSSCEPGANAVGGCANGNDADLINCFAGGAANNLGPDACSTGDIPTAFCDTGSSPA